MPELEVDARNRECPVPMLLVRAALADMLPGQRVRLLTTDIGSRRDIPIFAAMCGHALEEIDESDGVVSYLLSKGDKK